MTPTLYGLSLSHPSRAAHEMLALKRVDHRVVDLIPGFHPPILRAVGFSGYTVPALMLDGRRIQGSLEIAQELERLVPEPSLYPADPDLRRRVEEAEIWGESDELQGIPRRLARWAAARHQHVRRWLTAEIAHMPLPDLFGRMNAPLAAAFARASGGTDEAVRADMAQLPGTLARIDALIANGTIGAEDPNAADFQIAATVRVLLAFEDLRDAVEPTAAAKLARR
ncbi:MAG: glutathione S-transferase, partial [Thermoleophilaceae bacterium]